MCTFRSLSQSLDAGLLDYLTNALRVTDPKRIGQLMTKNGVGTLNEFIALCEQEREELYIELKDGGVVLGDRSKLRRATGEAIASWVTMDTLDRSRAKLKRPTNRSSFISKFFSFGSGGAASTASDRSDSDRGTDTASQSSYGSVSTSLGPRPGATSPQRVNSATVGTLQGSPAWWKSHDEKMRKMAKAMVDRDTAYSWEESKDSPDYHQLLWDRRGELLREGFADDANKRKEWLALILEIDATAGQSGPTFKKPNNSDYSWFCERGSHSYTKTLLARRSEMLEMNLTKEPALQAEWVMLMRELEAALQTMPSLANASTTEDDGTASRVVTSRSTIPTNNSSELENVEDGKSSDHVTPPPDSPDSPQLDRRVIAGSELTVRSIREWQTEVHQSLKRSGSQASLMSDGSEFYSTVTANDIQRVASLASFYADSTRTEDFFTGSEQEETEEDNNEVPVCDAQNSSVNVDGSDAENDGNATTAP